MVVGVVETNAVDHQPHAERAVSVEIVIFIADVDAVDVQLDTLEKAENPTYSWRHPKLGWLLFRLFSFFLSKLFFLFGSLLLGFFLLLATLLSLFLFLILVLLLFAVFILLTNLEHPDYVLDLVRFVRAVSVIKVIMFGDVICTWT